MATAAEFLSAIEALVDELEGDLGLPAGVDLPREPLPTVKQMMMVLEPRLRAIAVAVPAGGTSAPPAAVDLAAVLGKLDELGDAAGDIYRMALAVNSGVDTLLERVTPPPAPPPVPLPPESADGTESPPAPMIVDATGRVWDLVRAYDLVVYKGHQVHVRDGAAWFAWTADSSVLGGSWTPSSDPRGGEVPPPTPVNQAPRFEAQPGGASFTEGKAARVTVPYRASDPDGDPLFARVVGELPAGVTVAAVSSVAVDLDYDGRELGATATNPVAKDVALEVSDGRN